MSHRSALLFLGFLASVSSTPVLAKTVPASNPQALQLAVQSIAAMSGGNSISDITLTGNVTWTAGDDEIGPATLQALGTGESRLDFSLPTGTRTEIRDASTGTALGKWISQSGPSGKFASQNCQTDAVWFFPALGSLTGGANVIFSYVGQETHNGTSVQHIQSYVYQAQGPGTVQQQLSTMDFYLDATTLLPSAIVFNTHPDTNALSNLPVEVDFSNYQAFNGVQVPTHIQKYLQGTLVVDLTVTGVALNTGITLSTFSTN